MKTVVTLTNSIEIEDGQGNKYSIQSMAGNLSIQNGQVYFQPSMHQARESVAQVARQNAELNDEPYNDPFILSPSDVENDQELSTLFDQVEDRICSLLKDKLDNI